jgi:hypothetical protein
MEDAESHALRGAIDAGVLYDFRTEFERLEPLASGSLDDVLSPGELRLQFDNGIGEAERATLTVRWSVKDGYNILYSDGAERNLQWGVHPHDYTAPEGDGHYPPPPNALSEDSDVEAPVSGLENSSSSRVPSINCGGPHTRVGHPARSTTR